MRRGRAEALDALDNLACKLEAVATLMNTETTIFKENEMHGLYLLITAAARKIRQAGRVVGKLLPAN